jgi:hypothetical protein
MEKAISYKLTLLFISLKNYLDASKLKIEDYLKGSRFINKNQISRL